MRSAGPWRRTLCTVLKERQRACVNALALDRPAYLIPEVPLGTVGYRCVWDDIASPDESRRAANVAMQAMEPNCDADGDSARLLPPDIPAAESLLGPSGFALFSALRERVGLKVCEQWPSAVPVGNLISWISVDGVVGRPPPPANSLHAFNRLQDPLAGTYAPHVDKANRPEYDISALLYLSTIGEDFVGGHFAFNDSDCDRLVEPIAGRLLTFSSGFENPHQVRRVHWGNRIVLSVWFACDEVRLRAEDSGCEL